MKPWSKLSAQEKREWLNKARMQTYPGLEPATDAKEQAIPGLARELYYDATKHGIISDAKLKELMRRNYDL